MYSRSFSSPAFARFRKCIVVKRRIY